MHTEYKKKLEEERVMLMGELTGLGTRDAGNKEWEATPDTSDMETADTNSSADRFEDFEEKSALITPLEARLKQVEEALARLSNGTYGLCRVCKNAIEKSRLEANPAAETCMAHLEE